MRLLIYNKKTKKHKHITYVERTIRREINIGLVDIRG